MIQRIDEKTVFVSDIRSWAACPRQFYFKSATAHKSPVSLPAEAENRVFESAVWREILMELPALILEKYQEEETFSFAGNTAFEAAVKAQVQTVTDLFATLAEFEKFAGRENQISERMAEAAQNIDKTLQRNGIGLFECAASPVFVEKTFWFPEADLAGAPAKVLKSDGKLLPYLIRTGKPPQDGVWESDRTAAAGYLMILESGAGKRNVSDTAVVDYFGDMRQIRIYSSDRKKVFRAVRRIREIKKGKMPSEKNGRLCPKCIYKEKCGVKSGSLLSKLIRQQ